MYLGNIDDFVYLGMEFDDFGNLWFATQAPNQSSELYKFSPAGILNTVQLTGDLAGELESIFFQKFGNPLTSDGSRVYSINEDYSTTLVSDVSVISADGGFKDLRITSGVYTESSENSICYLAYTRTPNKIRIYRNNLINNSYSYYEPTYQVGNNFWQWGAYLHVRQQDIWFSDASSRRNTVYRLSGDDLTYFTSGNSNLPSEGEIQYIAGAVNGPVWIAYGNYILRHD